MAGAAEPERRGAPRQGAGQQGDAGPAPAQARPGHALWRHPLLVESCQGPTGRHRQAAKDDSHRGPGRASLSWQVGQPEAAHSHSSALAESGRKADGDVQGGQCVRVEIGGAPTWPQDPDAILGPPKLSTLQHDLRRLAVCCCLVALCLLPLPGELHEWSHGGTHGIKQAVWGQMVGTAGQAEQNPWVYTRLGDGPQARITRPEPTGQAAGGPSTRGAPIKESQPSLSASKQGQQNQTYAPRIQPAARGTPGAAPGRPGPAAGQLPALQQVTQPSPKQAPLRQKLLASDALAQNKGPALGAALASGKAQESGAKGSAGAVHDRAQSQAQGSASTEAMQGPKKPIWLKPQRDEGDPPPMFPPFKPGVPWWWQGTEAEVEQRLFGEGRRYYRPEGVWGHDWCAGEGHFKWSFTCIAAEAKYLDRVLVLNTDLCLIPLHNRGKEARPPFAAFYNLTTLAMHQPFVPESIFLHALDKFQQKQAQKQAAAPTVLEVGLEPSSDDLKKATNATLIVRDVGPTGYGFSICGLPNSPLERDWGLLEMVRPLGEIANQISGSMHWDHDAVHVRRGDKLDPRGWPHLDNDTQAPALLEKLPKFIEPGRDVYLSTNEYKPGFFDALKVKYKIHLLSDYSYLWDKTSAWYRWAKTIMKEPDFNGRMQAIIDYAVFSRGKKKVETFNDLTTDKRHGNWAER